MPKKHTLPFCKGQVTCVPASYSAVMFWSLNNISNLYKSSWASISHPKASSRLTLRWQSLLYRFSVQRSIKWVYKELQKVRHLTAMSKSSSRSAAGGIDCQVSLLAMYCWDCEWCFSTTERYCLPDTQQSASAESNMTNMVLWLLLKHKSLCMTWNFQHLPLPRLTWPLLSSSIKVCLTSLIYQFQTFVINTPAYSNHLRNWAVHALETNEVPAIVWHAWNMYRGTPWEVQIRPI